MLLSFFYLRFKQISRELQALGLGRSLFVLFLLAFGQAFVVSTVRQLPDAHYLMGFYALIPLIVHFKRSDHAFLKTHIVEYPKVYGMEYLLLSLPLVTPLVYYGHFVLAAIYLVFIALLTLIPVTYTVPLQYHRVLQIIPDEDFEWKSGIRKYFWVLLPVWILGIATSWFVVSVPFVLFILGLIILSFYDQGESLNMVLAYEKPPSGFLGWKIKRCFIRFLWLVLPLIAVFVVFHPQWWYIPVTECILFLNLHVYSILVKYAFYQPNTKSTASQTLIAFGVLGTLIPIFLPLVWLLDIRFYKKACAHLNTYLYDFH